MKCEKHPDTDAVGACVSCGRGVCPICKISYNNMIHCKECIEAGRVGGHQYAAYWAQPGMAPGSTPYGQPMTPGQPGAPPGPQPGAMAPAAYPYGYAAYPYSYYPSYYGGGTFGLHKATPQPRGIPNGGLFKIGTAGCIFLAIIGLVMGFIVMNTSTSSHNTYAQALILGSIMVMMAMFPFGLGLFGFYKNYGSIWGLLGSVSIFITSVMYPVLLYNAVLNAHSDYDYYQLDTMWMYVAHMTFGIGLIMAGLAMNQAKRYFEVERQMQGVMTFATGGLAIAGILFCAWVGMYMVGWIAMAVSLFMLSMEFYHAPVPDAQEDEEKVKADFFLTDSAKKPGGTATGQQAPSSPNTPTYATNPTYAKAPSGPVYPDYGPPKVQNNTESISEEERWDVIPTANASPLRKDPNR